MYMKNRIKENCRNLPGGFFIVKLQKIVIKRVVKHVRNINKQTRILPPNPSHQPYCLRKVFNLSPHKFPILLSQT